MSLLLLFTGDVIAPTAIVSDLTTSKISRVAGKDITYVSFTVDEECQAWKVKKVSSSSAIHTDGTLIDSGGSIPVESLFVIDITDDELVDGSGSEGDNLIKLFVQDMSGNWSV